MLGWCVASLCGFTVPICSLRVILGSVGSVRMFDHRLHGRRIITAIFSAVLEGFFCGLYWQFRFDADLRLLRSSVGRCASWLRRDAFFLLQPRLFGSSLPFAFFPLQPSPFGSSLSFAFFLFQPRFFGRSLAFAFFPPEAGLLGRETLFVRIGLRRDRRSGHTNTLFQGLDLFRAAS